MSEITIKRGTVTLKAERKDLLEVTETHDGVVFKFKGGLDLYQIDHHMPSSVKQLMSNSAASFEKGELIFELDNYKTPIRVQVG